MDIVDRKKDRDSIMRTQWAIVFDFFFHFIRQNRSDSYLLVQKSACSIAIESERKKAK